MLAPFETSPKRLDAVGMCLPVHRLAYAVLHKSMLAAYALIRCRLTRMFRLAPPHWSSPGRSLVRLPCQWVQQALRSPACVSISGSYNDHPTGAPGAARQCGWTTAGMRVGGAWLEASAWHEGAVRRLTAHRGAPACADAGRRPAVWVDDRDNRPGGLSGTALVHCKGAPCHGQPTPPRHARSAGRTLAAIGRRLAPPRHALQGRVRPEQDIDASGV